MIRGGYGDVKAPWSAAAPAHPQLEGLRRQATAYRGRIRDVAKTLLSATFSLAAQRHRAAPQSRPAGGRPVIGWICGEFFHPEAGGFGGLGRTVKNLTEHYNRAQNGGPRIDVFLPRHDDAVERPTLTRLHNADVIVIPRLKRLARHPASLLRLVGSQRPDVFVSMGFFPGYEYVLWAAPQTPLIVYLRDPRGDAEWRRIARAAPLDAEVEADGDRHHLLRLAAEHRSAFARVRRQARRSGRRIVFASNAECLVERARRKLGLPQLTAWPLPNPIPMPDDGSRRAVEAVQPTLLWLGRLDPVKRPGLVVDLARRLPHVRFVMAGRTHHEGLVRPVIEAARETSNIDLVGLVDGAEKAAWLQSCWAVLNTSAHEALPVSFLEAFSYAKPVVSFHNPDGLLDRFGYRAGSVLDSDGEVASLDGIEAAIVDCLSNADERRRRGAAARRYVRQNHTFERFDRCLRTILRHEALLPREQIW